LSINKVDVNYSSTDQTGAVYFRGSYERKIFEKIEVSKTSTPVEAFGKSPRKSRLDENSISRIRDTEFGTFRAYWLNIYNGVNLKKS
jgi:hypothetical protein